MVSRRVILRKLVFTVKFFYIEILSYKCLLMKQTVESLQTKSPHIMYIYISPFWISLIWLYINILKSCIFSSWEFENEQEASFILWNYTVLNCIIMTLRHCFGARRFLKKMTIQKQNIIVITRLKEITCVHDLWKEDQS